MHGIWTFCPAFSLEVTRRPVSIGVQPGKEILQLIVRKGQRSATWLARGFDKANSCRFTLIFPVTVGAQIRLQCGDTVVLPVGAPSPEWSDVLPLAAGDVIDMEMTLRGDRVELDTAISRSKNTGPEDKGLKNTFDLPARRFRYGLFGFDSTSAEEEIKVEKVILSPLRNAVEAASPAPAAAASGNKK